MSRRQSEDESTIAENVSPGVVGNCFICLPEAAVRVLGLTPNMDDKGEKVKRFWFGRVWQLRALEMIKYKRNVLSKMAPLSQQHKKQIDEAMQDPKKRAMAMKVQKVWRGALERSQASLKGGSLSKISFRTDSYAGTVIFMHGSGGMTYNNVRYVRKLASMGFLVIAPDSMAGGEYRRRDLAGLITPSQLTPYWDDLGIYTSSAAGELTYSTDAEAVVKDPEKWRVLYENVFRQRSLEMHWILARLPQQIRVRGVFTMGQSEGAMTVARFDDSRYGAMIRGRIISAFSVEYCYFTPTREAATWGGSNEVATLQIIGDADQYFGPKDSVAAHVAAKKGFGGWGTDKLTGHGFAEMKKKQIRRGLVCVMEGAQHDASELYDNFLRDILRAFLATPDSCHRIVEQWEPDPYLVSKVKVLELDTKPHGFRMLMRVSKMDRPATLEYSRELLARRGFTGKLAATAAGFKRGVTPEGRINLLEKVAKEDQEDADAEHTKSRL